MKRFLTLFDWLLMILIGGCIGLVAAHYYYRERIATVQQSMCETAYLLTRKSSDTIALIARQHACVQQLSQQNTKDPFPYDTVFTDSTK